MTTYRIIGRFIGITVCLYRGDLYLGRLRVKDFAGKSAADLALGLRAARRAHYEANGVRDDDLIAALSVARDHCIDLGLVAG